MAGRRLAAERAAAAVSVASAVQQNAQPGRVEERHGLEVEGDLGRALVEGVAHRRADALRGREIDLALQTKSRYAVLENPTHAQMTHARPFQRFARWIAAPLMHHSHGHCPHEGACNREG